MPRFYHTASRIPDCHFKTKKKLWTCLDSIGQLPESTIFIFREKTASSMPGFYRRASRVPDCHFSENKQPWAHPVSIAALPESQYWLHKSQISIFQKKNTQPRAHPNSIGGFPESQIAIFPETKTRALSTSGFDRMAFGIPNSIFSRTTTASSALGGLPESQMIFFSKRNLEHTWILSEGFQNLRIGF